MLAVVALVAGVFILRRSGVPIGIGNWQLGGRPSPTPSAGSGPPIVDIAVCDSVQDVSQQEDCKKLGPYQWQKETLSVAIKADNPALCKELFTSELRDNCRMQYVYKDAKHNLLCAEMETETRRSECDEQVISSSSDDFTECAAIKETASRDKCYGQVIGSHLSEGAGYCNQFKAADKTMCLEIHWTLRAIGKTEYSFCRNIPIADGIERCLQSLPRDSDGDGLSDYGEDNVYGTDSSTPDSDSDGLNDYEEVRVYKTNPNIADTDGDGFLDGQEVKSGFNPKGPGKLKP